MFRKKIKCIDNTNYPVSLTVGKKYKVLGRDLGMVKIKDDTKEIYYFSGNLFEDKS